MTIDATKPADSDLISTLGLRGREEREAINALESAIAALGAVATVTRYVCSAGQTTIPVGVTGGLSNLKWELVLISGGGAAAIQNLTGGTEGQMKIFIMLDANVTFVRDATKMDLNQPAVVADFGGYAGDVIAFANENGNPATSTNGFWKELFRTPSAK